MAAAQRAGITNVGMITDPMGAARASKDKDKKLDVHLRRQRAEAPAARRLAPFVAISVAGHVVLVGGCSRPRLGALGPS